MEASDKSGVVPPAKRLRYLLWPPHEPELDDAGRAGEVMIAKARLLVFTLLIPPSIVTCVRSPSDPAGWLSLMMAFICIVIGWFVLRRARRGDVTQALQKASALLDITLISGYHVLLFVAGEISMVLDSRVTFSLYLIAIVGAALRYDGQLVRIAGLAAAIQYMAIVAWAGPAGRVNAYANNFYGDPSLAGQGEELFMFLMITVLCSILVERARELRLSGIRDPLTKLPNRSYFADRFATALKQNENVRGTAAVAMLDIDHFKVVNDTYGHETGDAVIRQVAAELRRSVRSGDLVARIGGEEFAIYLANTSLDNAYKRMDALRIAMAQQDVRSGDRAVRVTVSIGLAMTPDDGLDAQTLLAAADARLLIGKRSGRNTVVAK